jgi:DNA-binding transcriptional MerR regulator
MGQARGGWMTIEDLSARAGVTTRNIRAYQSRGLLPAPVARPGARAAFYTPAHLARLRLVSRLQERGFSLAGIGDLLGAWAAGKSVEQVLGIESAAAESTEEASRLVSARELRALTPPGVDFDATLARLLAVGLVERQGKRYRIRHARVFDLGAAAVRAGIPLAALLDEFVRLQSDLRDVALRFVALFAQHVLQPFIQAGSPADQLPAVVEQMKRLRGLAVEATAALIRQSIADEIEAATRASLPGAPGAGGR